MSCTENCVFGDKKGEVFSGMSCANIPRFMCSIVPDCCASCAPPRTTSFSQTTTPTTRLLKAATIPLVNTTIRSSQIATKPTQTSTIKRGRSSTTTKTTMTKVAFLTKTTLHTIQSITLSQAYFTTTNATGTFKTPKQQG